MKDKLAKILKRDEEIGQFTDISPSTSTPVFLQLDKGNRLPFPSYSRLSLSRIRLFRITAYLEEKSWSMFKLRNLTSGYKILRIRGEIAPQEQFLPFPAIFSIYIYRTKGV